MNYLSAQEILLIHYKLIERYGGSHGTRDLARVESAATAPAQTAFGQEQYSGAFLKAAVYARNIIADHPFADENKRTGNSAAVMFLKRNDYNFKANKGEVEDFAVRIAIDKLSVEQISEWLESHTVQD